MSVLIARVWTIWPYKDHSNPDYLMTLCCKCSFQFESHLMLQDCSGNTGGLCSNENKFLLQTSVALCMLDASEAYLELQHSEAALPCDNAAHKHHSKELARAECVLPWASAWKTVFKRSGGCYMTFQEMSFPFWNVLSTTGITLTILRCLSVP